MFNFLTTNESAQKTKIPSYFNFLIFLRRDTKVNLL